MKTTTVGLVIKTQAGTDPFGAPIYAETVEQVSGVLVGQPTTQEINTTLNLHGKRTDYVLGIPKGDTHSWTDTAVIIWGRRFETIGEPETAEEANIPLYWGQKVKVRRNG